MTSRKATGNLAGTLDNSSSVEEDIGLDMLLPLRQGKPVVLRVTDPGRFYKKRAADNPLLFLTPLTMYGGPSPNLLIAYPAYGSEVVDTRERIKPSRLALLGLSYPMAKALAGKLNQVFRQGE